MTVLLIICISVVFACTGFRDAVMRMMRSEQDIMDRRRTVDIGARNTSYCVRVAAKFAISQRQDIAYLERELVRIEEGNIELKSVVTALCEKPKRRRWVLEGSMRGMTGRFDFIVSTEDPEKSFGRAGLPEWNLSMWRVGRFVSIAGTSRDDAYRRAFARWPEQAGFTIRDAVYGE